MARLHQVALKLPADYYPPIGEITFRWAQLEYQMQEIIWRALDLDNKRGRALTVGMPARTLISTLRTLRLRWLTHPTDKQSADSIAGGASKVIDFRNHLAHGSWQFPQGGNPNDVYLHFMKEAEQRILPKAARREPPVIWRSVEKLRQLNDKADRLIRRLEKQQKERLLKCGEHTAADRTSPTHKPSV